MCMYVPFCGFIVYCSFFSCSEYRLKYGVVESAEMAALVALAEMAAMLQNKMASNDDRVWRRVNALSCSPASDYFPKWRPTKTSFGGE